MEMVNIQADRQAIEQMLKRTEAAENRHDVEAMLGEMTEDPLIHLCGLPPTQGQDAIRQLYGAFFETFISTNFAPQKITISSAGDMAWDSGGYVNTLKGPDGPVKEEGKYLGIYQKVDGKWKGAAFCITPNGE
jgi:uncharacterized protein (TIGR02246 family)